MCSHMCQSSFVYYSLVHLELNWVNAHCEIFVGRSVLQVLNLLKEKRALREAGGSHCLQCKSVSLWVLTLWVF